MAKFGHLRGVTSGIKNRVLGAGVKWKNDTKAGKKRRGLRAGMEKWGKEVESEKVQSFWLWTSFGLVGGGEEFRRRFSKEPQPSSVATLIGA
jgi:hypothetical protein